MNHSLTPTLATLVGLAVSVPCFASDTTRYELEHLKTPAGWLKLTERKTGNSVQARIEINGTTYTLSGKLRKSGQRLRGILEGNRTATGIANRLESPKGEAKSKRTYWIASIAPQQLRIRVALFSQASDGSNRVRLDLTGQVDLGRRNKQNERVIRSFFENFRAKNATAMLRSYADQATFSDVVFPNLSPADSRAMWRMLCTSEDLRVSFRGIRAGDRYGVGEWVAIYTFAGKPIRNVIKSSFKLAEGKIQRHEDWYDFKVWARQGVASGSKGILLKSDTTTSALLALVRWQAAKQLEEFRKTTATTQRPGEGLPLPRRE